MPKANAAEVLARAEAYGPTRWDQHCCCTNPDCRMRVYGGRYFIVQFETDSIAVVWWFGKN